METIQWACKRAGITGRITPHSLRHAFALRALRAGIPIRMIQIALGHSSVKVTELYTRIMPDALAAEFERF